MHVIKKLVSDTAIYGLSSIVGRLLNYVLVPFYTSLFLPAEYGIITEFYAYAAFLSILYTGGLETTYFRFASQPQSSQSFNIAMSMLLVSSVSFSLLLIGWATPLINWLGYKGCERFIYYLVATLTIDALLAIPFAQLRLQKQALFFASAKLLQIGLNLILNFLLLYGLQSELIGKIIPKLGRWLVHAYNPGKRLDYVFIANLIANAAILPLFTKSLWQFKFQLPWQKVKPMLLYAFPLLLMGLAGTVNEMLSRLLLRFFLLIGPYTNYTSHTDALGIFGACYKLAIFMPLCVQALRYAAEPLLFTHAQDHDAPKLFSQIMQGYIIFACFVLFAITANLDVLGYVFLRNSAYRTGLEIVPYLVFAYLWLGIYYQLSIWFKLAGKTYYGTRITSIGALVTVLANVLLVPHWGYWGSVWATVASYITMTCLCYYQGQKHYPIPYHVARGLAYIVVTLGLVPIVRSIVYSNWYSHVLTNLGLTLAFGLLACTMLYKEKIAQYNLD